MGQNNGSRYRTLRRTQGVRRRNKLMHRFHLYCCPSSAPYSQTADGTPRLNSTTPNLQYSTETKEDATVPFMHQRCEDVSYLCDETFGWERVDIPFDDDSELRIVLPDPETLETLVHDPIALRRAFSTELAETIPQEDKQELTGMDRLKAKLAARKNPTPVRNRQRHQRKNTGRHPAFIGHHRCIRSHTCGFLWYMRRGARHQRHHAGHAHRSQRAWGASRRVHRHRRGRRSTTMGP